MISAIFFFFLLSVAGINLPTKRSKEIRCFKYYSIIQR